MILSAVVLLFTILDFVFPYPSKRIKIVHLISVKKMFWNFDEDCIEFAFIEWSLYINSTDPQVWEFLYHLASPISSSISYIFIT